MIAAARPIDDARDAIGVHVAGIGAGTAEERSWLLASHVLVRPAYYAVDQGVVRKLGRWAGDIEIKGRLRRFSACGKVLEQLAQAASHILDRCSGNNTDV